MVSWSLLTVHITPAIALQLMRGLYNGQQRPLTSKKTPKFRFQKWEEATCSSLQDSATF